jgi:hypothetical protein
MGGGSKKTETSHSEQGSAQKWANPYAMDAVKSITDVYNANKENLAQQSADANAFAKTLQGGYNAAGSVGNAGSNYFNKVMNGAYLGNNPYLQGMIDSTNKDVTNNVNSQFTLAGRYGSGAHTGVLTDQLASAENALRYQDYGSERDRMTAAAQGSVEADAARAQAQTAAAQQALAAQTIAAQLPYMGSESLASALNALFSGGVSDSSAVTKSGGGLMGGLTGALGAAAGLGWNPLASKG